MKIASASTALIASLLFLGLCIQPVSAHSGGGGGHAGGGGGHGFSGHAGGGGHIAAAHYSGGGYAGAHYNSGFRASGRVATAGAGYGGHTAVASGYGTRADAHVGGRYGRPGGGWGGGYWGGRFWPGVYYGAGFAWFLPVLPLYCPTYYWNDIPYYYYNDAYYTWSPSADGYVATDPPPTLNGAGPSDTGAAGYPGGDQAAAAAAAPATDNIYAYPSQGQSAAQQSSDRQECAQWAASQAGASSGSPDYRRALIACFQGRGYSAQ